MTKVRKNVPKENFNRRFIVIANFAYNNGKLKIKNVE